VLGVVVPVPGLDWAVVVEQDRAEAYRVLRTTWQTALAVGALFAGIALFLGLLLGRRLAQPVLAIAAAARRVAGGDFDARVDVDRRDEVGELSGSFNRMATDLADYRDRLVDETRIRTNLSRYLSPDVVETIVAQRTDLALGGTRREVTVLFADVVAFTPLAERVEPERVVAILNELFTFLTEIVFRHGGTVDKFVGDCVMAVFGAPYGAADDPVRAVRAADEMMRWLDVGNARWSKEIGCDLQLAIGMNTGTAVAGNIGSTRRMEYTVIGDAVNLAARLESLARPGQVLMTRATRDRVAGEFECVHVATARLPGRSEETEMWALAE
jgi:class 3 adenylate cyclase